MTFGPCLCGDPGCGSCFPVAREPGDNEVVLVELPGGEVIQTRYGELPDYGDRYEWIEEEPPSELEEALEELDPEADRLFYRLYHAEKISGTPVADFPGFRFGYANAPDDARLTEVLLVCSGFVEDHTVEKVFVNPKDAFDFAEKVAERESKFFKETYVRTRDATGNEIAVWSRRDGRFGGPNRLIGYVSIERHFIEGAK